MEYVIIPDWKVAIGMEDVEELEETEVKGLEDVLNDNNIDDDDIVDIKIDNLTMKNIATLYKFYDAIQATAGMDIDKLFLFWLSSRDIGYELIPEDDIKQYEDDGYRVINLENE